MSCRRKPVSVIRRFDRVRDQAGIELLLQRLHQRIVAQVSLGVALQLGTLAGLALGRLDVAGAFAENPLVALGLVLLGLSASFSGSETAFFALTPAERETLRHGNAAARGAAGLDSRRNALQRRKFGHLPENPAPCRACGKNALGSEGNAPGTCSIGRFSAAPAASGPLLRKA